MKIIPIHIITGFLGAGKTTLLQKLLKDGFPNERVVLIENEFGDVNMDAKFLEDTGIVIRELTAGCICCSLTIEFGAALRTIMETYQPDRIFIEPTGVAKMKDVEKAIALANQPNIAIESVSAVVCGPVCADYLDGYGDFYEDQMRQASCILLNQLEEMSREEQAEVLTLVRQINPQASLITTPWAQLTTQEIWAAMTHPHRTNHSHIHCDCQECHGHDHEHDHEHCTHDPVAQGPHFQSLTIETACVYAPCELSQLLDEAREGTYGEVLRIKGMVMQDETQWVYFDATSLGQHIRPGRPQLLGIIAITGCHLNTQGLQALFQRGG